MKLTTFLASYWLICAATQPAYGEGLTFSRETDIEFGTYYQYFFQLNAATFVSHPLAASPRDHPATRVPSYPPSHTRNQSFINNTDNKHELQPATQHAPSHPRDSPPT
jgi:hypothetical protein